MVAYGLFWETGCGKTKPLIDTASYLFLENRIKALVIVAPNGVHRNWLSDEIPAHMPEDVRRQTMSLIWQSNKVKNKGFQKHLKELAKHEGLVAVVVAYEATITPAFKAWAKKFLDSRPTMLVLDESHRIKSASSKVKTTLVALGSHAKYRRIASGTPLERPFDLYPQLRFLDPVFWKVRGFPTYADFQQRFGTFVSRTFGARSFDQLVGYKNLPELSEWIQEVTWRLTKEDAGLNLPPKVYTKRYCQLTPEQTRVYNELRDKFRVQLESGDELVANSAITRLLRLQQVICGYVSVAAEQPVQRIDSSKNPRMDLACDEILDSLPHQSIIWHRFTADIDEMCRRLGDKCVRYDGQVDDEGRALAKKQFQSGDKQFFVASKAASTGLTLIGSKTMVFYSNDFELINRLQKEDRQHRIGQDVSVTYLDIVAEGTVDEYIVSSLVKKQDIVTQVLQDSIRPWI
jgi:SNF2 family DNA or RNA helicase